MAHPMQDEYKRSQAAKHKHYGVKGEFPPAKADRLAGTGPGLESKGLRREEPLREMQELPSDPKKAAEQLNEPKHVPGKKGY